MANMRRLETEFTPDECARILRMSIRQEWGRYESVRGWVIGRFFRLVLQEYVPSAGAAKVHVPAVYCSRLCCNGVDVPEA